MCEQLLAEQGVDLQEEQAGFRIRLTDGSVIKEPGKTGSQWRLHYSLRLPACECDQFLITPAKGRDNGEKFGKFLFRAGELVLGDAGFSNPSGVQSVVTTGANLCVRLNPFALPLYNRKGQRLDLENALRSVQTAGQIANFPVWVQAGDQKIEGRLCVLRKSQLQIQKAERQLRDRIRRKVSKGSPLTRLCSHYVLVFTTLTGEQATAQKILDLYRLRWQIELNFKRLKSIAQVGHLPKYDDRSSRAWLYAKLFLALLTEKMARIGRSISPWGYLLPNPEPPLTNRPDPRAS
jgi:hypothetical protein